MITPNIEIDNRAVAEHYDELDYYYRKLWGEHLHHGLWVTGNESPQVAVLQLMSHVADALEVGAGDRVCDVGCGYGGTSRYLADEHSAEVTGLTISPAQFQYATEHADSAHLTFLLRDWQQNQLDSQSFDKLVSIECVAHVTDKPLYFREVRRVLKAGGRGVVTAWLTSEQPSESEQRKLLEPICREGRLPGMGSESEYAQLIEAARLRLVRFEDLSQQVMRTWDVCIRRVTHTLLTSPRAWWFLLSRKTSHAVFLRTIWRLKRAYRCGAMRYGLFVVERDAGKP